VRQAALVAQVEEHTEEFGSAVSGHGSGLVEKDIGHTAAVVGVDRTEAPVVEFAVSVAELVLVGRLVRRRRRGLKYRQGP